MCVYMFMCITCMWAFMHTEATGQCWASSLLTFTFSVLKKFINFMCVSVLHSWMCLYNAYAWGVQRPEESVESPGTGASDGFELLCGRWDLNLAPLLEQRVP